MVAINKINIDLRDDEAFNTRNAQVHSGHRLIPIVEFVVKKGKLAKNIISSRCHIGEGLLVQLSHVRGMNRRVTIWSLSFIRSAVGITIITGIVVAVTIIIVV